MNKFFRRISVKAAAFPLLALGAVQAHAAPVDDILNAVDLSGILTVVTALSIVIVGIALAFKGPTLAKRIITRV